MSVHEVITTQVNMMEQLDGFPLQSEYLLPEMGRVEVFDKVYVTYDYSIFKLIKTNRNLNAKNRAKILKSRWPAQIFCLERVGAAYLFHCQSWLF